MQPENQGNFWQPQGEPPQGTQTPVPPAVAPPVSDSLHWQASEYVHHEKEGLWFLPLAIGAVVLLLISIFLIQSYTFAILIVAMTIALAVYAVRPPRILDYELSTRGIKINDKVFAYHDFRNFGIIQDGPLFSATLIPNKRFMPAVNIYFPEENGEEIVDILGEYLPIEKAEPDIFDKLMRRLRF